MKRVKLMSLLILMAFLVVSCKSSDDDDSSDDSIPAGLNGSYVDNYSGPHTISATRWQMGDYGFAITKINTDESYLIAKNDSSNAYAADKYSRIDWINVSADTAYYCQIAFDAESADAAEAVTSADSSDPANGGCGDFAWSELSRFSEITGNYVDNYSTSHFINAAIWMNGNSSFIISKIEADSDYLIARNDAGNAYFGDKYSRFDWTVDAAGDLYFCQTAYNADTATEAEAVAGADTTSPSSGGCGGFAWSKLSVLDEIVGEYVDDYSGVHSISANQWTNTGSGFTVTKVDTTNDYLIALNSSANDYYPDLYSRFDWTIDGNGDLYYCQTAYDASTDTLAESTDAPDSSSPSTGGCGSNSFAWSKLDAFEELNGEFVDNYSGTHSISTTRWENGTSGYEITKIDTTNQFFIAKNDADNAYNAGKYSRFDWAKDAHGNKYYCQIAYDADSAADAESVTAPDGSSPSTGGCSGFAWSQLIAYPQ